MSRFFDPFGHGVADDDVSTGSDAVVAILVDVVFPLGRHRAPRNRRELGQI